MQEKTQTKLSRKAQNLLFHPLTLGTILLYFINNHILQIKYPSWLTGKISGFAWLFFIPYIALFIFSFIFPEKFTKHKYFDLSVFTFLGLSYSLVKTTSGANQAVSNFLQSVLGLTTQIIQDPSDLLALFALAVSFYFWKNFKPTYQKFSFPKSLVILSVVSVFTLADSAAPDYGIAHLNIYEEQIIASSRYINYASQDGGLTWEESSTEQGIYYDEIKYPISASSEDETINVRVIDRHILEISTDSGKTWHAEYDLKPQTDAQLSYYRQQDSGDAIFETGPLDIIIDPKTSNIIFAMGKESILFRSIKGEWIWIEINSYEQIDYSNIDTSFLGGEILIGIMASLLMLSTISHKQHPTPKKEKVWFILTIIGWFSLIMISPLLSSSLPLSLFDSFLFDGLEIPLGLMSLICAPIISIIAGIRYSIRPIRAKKLVVFIYSFLSIPIFITPFILWLKDIIEYGILAFAIAMALHMIVLIIGLKNTSSIDKIPMSNE